MTTSVNVPQSFQCPITGDIMTDPVKTNCPSPANNPDLRGHIYERLALANWFRTDPDLKCPTCRHIVTEVTPDEELATRIQNEFVRANAANAQHFATTRQELLRDHANLVRQPVIPLQPVIRRRRVEEHSPLQDPIFRAFLFAREPEPIPRPMPPVRINPITRAYRGITTFFHNILRRLTRQNPSHLFFEVRNLIRAENLLRAEQVADTNPNPSLKDRSYEAIAFGYILRRTNFNLHEAERITEKINNPNLKNNLFSIIAENFSRNREYSHSLRVINKITNPLSRVGNYLAFGLTSIINTFGLVLGALGIFFRGIFAIVLLSVLIFPIRAVVNRLRE